MTAENSNWRIYLDCEITRRKRYHIVANHFGDTAFTSPNLETCLCWCADEGHRLIQIVGEHWTWWIWVQHREPLTEDAHQVTNEQEPGLPF